MSHTIYCDRCGRESRNDVEPHEEQNILPGPVKGRDFHNLYSPREIEFIRLGEHRETTGDRIWCELCWDEVTASEVSPYWRREFEDNSTRRQLRNHKHWQKTRCFGCAQWLEVCVDCPEVETTRYTVLLETAADPIDGWFYGVFFQDGKAIDVRCPKCMPSRKAA